MALRYTWTTAIPGWLGHGTADISHNPLPPAPPPSNDRNLLVLGDYEPDATTTGLLPGTVLDPTNPAHCYNDPSVNTFTLAPGQVIENKIIYGDLLPPASGGATIRNCLCVGGNHVPGSAQGVFTMNGTGARTGIVLIEDTEIAPRRPSLNRDGIIGRQYTARRVNIHDTIDGCGVYANDGATSRADVQILGSYIHDLLYNFPDYNNGVSGAAVHADGNHNDDIQHQGGLGVTIRGNSLWGTSHAGPIYSPVTTSSDTKATDWVIPSGWNNGACLIIQAAGSRTIDTSTVVELNFTRGSLAHYNIKSTATSFVLQNNKVHRLTATHTNPTWSGYWVRIDAGTPTGGIQGLLTQTWLDGPYVGQQLTLASRDRGILVG